MLREKLARADLLPDQRYVVGATRVSGTGTCSVTELAGGDALEQSAHHPIKRRSVVDRGVYRRHVLLAGLGSAVHRRDALIDG